MYFILILPMNIVEHATFSQQDVKIHSREYISVDLFS
jgi:hypothetical protein